MKNGSRTTFLQSKDKKKIVDSVSLEFLTWIFWKFNFNGAQHMMQDVKLCFASELYISPLARRVNVFS